MNNLPIDPRTNQPLDASVVAMAKAIRTHESGGIYNVLGKSGEQGAYQWMPENYESAATKYGLNPKDFSPINQDKVAYYQVQELKNKGYNPQQVAVAWNAGEGALKNDVWKTKVGVNSKGVKYDTPAYVASVDKIYQQEKQNYLTNKSPEIPIISKPFRFDVAQTPADMESKKSAIATDDAVKQKEAGKYKGFLNMLGQTAKEVGNTITSSEQALGNTIGGIIGTNKYAKDYISSIQTLTKANTDTLKMIREKKAAGEDITKLERIYNSNADLIDQHQKELQDLISPTEKSTSKVAGELGGVALDTLSAGTYGKAATTGMEAGKLAAKSSTLPTAIQTIRKTATEPSGIFSKKGVSRIASGAGVGYGYDTTQKLQSGDETPFKPGVGTLIGAGLPFIPAAAKTIKPLSAAEKDTTIISKVQDELRKVENKYVKMRKAQTFSKDALAGSRERVATSNVLANAIDNTGLIRTTEPNGALNQYKKLTIDKAEDVVRKNLVREGAKVPLSVVEQTLLDEVNRTSLQGTDLVSAENKVKKEIEAYARKADANGYIPLELAHDAKINTYNGINFMTPPNVKTADKAIARGLKKVVENHSSFNVNEVNAEIGKYKEDLKYLKSLDGARVENGKLGKFVARLGGNLVGGAVGALGGPLGAAGGAYAGGEVAAKIAGKSMASKFAGRTGIFKKESPILEKAINLSKTERPLPAKIEGVDYTPAKGGSKYAPIKLGAPTSMEARAEKVRTSKTKPRNPFIPSEPYTPKEKLPVIQAGKKTPVKGVEASKLDPPKVFTPSKTSLTTDGNKAKLTTNKSAEVKKNTPTKFLFPKNKKGGFISMGGNNLTTKVLDKLEGRTSVSKQFISDLTNSPDLKQSERDLIRQTLSHFPEGNIPVKEFADKVKAELLPLKRRNVGNAYEQVNLPDNLRGDVENYSSHIYESPIKTSAGQIHFNEGEKGSKNYFGHSRVEDIITGENKESTTRRVIELQSDLYQKGNLEKELSAENSVTGNKIDMAKLKENYPKKYAEIQSKQKLQQYNNPTAHFRMAREEIKQAALDGKTKLQFPTGETAMKIEGLGDRDGGRFLMIEGDPLEVGDLEKGIEIDGNGGKWIITDVFGGGRFKAIRKESFDRVKELTNEPNAFGENTTPEFRQRQVDAQMQSFSEEFDISGKVDTNNPIYKFYEKDLGRYLKNNFGAKQVIDNKGVSWHEVSIDKNMATKPVQAFGKTALNPLFVGAAATAAGVAGVKILQPKKKK